MNREYAFLMVDYDTPKFISDLQDSINEDELYQEDGGGFGIERESHVTLVPCLDNDVDLDELKKYLKPLSEYKLMLTNISSFENEKYDVLKCDAQSMILHDTNSQICKHFPTHTEFKEYHPHMTIAYLKNGVASKYLKDVLPSIVVCKPKQFHFSYFDKDGSEKEIFFQIG